MATSGERYSRKGDTTNKECVDGMAMVKIEVALIPEQTSLILGGSG